MGPGWGDGVRWLRLLLWGLLGYGLWRLWLYGLQTQP
jgi:hypothetical protein